MKYTEILKLKRMLEEANIPFEFTDDFWGVKKSEESGNPCCAICAGFTPNAFIVDEKQIDLTGRKAICSYCNTIVDSSLNLPFFEYRPDKEYDSFYDGCWGWD